MSSQSSFRWRTIVEVALVSVVIYVFLGTPGLKSTFTSESPTQSEVPAARAKVESLVYPSKDLECPRHEYDVHIFSTSPLVLYVDGFLSAKEAQHLVDISSDKWQVSTVFNDGKEVKDEAVRKSEKALIDRDTLVQCVENRALSMQGWPEETFIERLWTQRYNVTGHYAYHYDWATGSKQSRRVSTFMVYLQADCAGGGTTFPRLQRPQDLRWCRYIECDGSSEIEGVTFKPRKGSAVFWHNFDAAGRGDPATIHAGMPVTAGTKVGLNIWSWYQAGHRAPN